MPHSSSQYADACRNALAAEQAESLQQTDGWSHVDRRQVHNDWDRLYRAFAALPEASEASSPAVHELVAQHYAIACRFYVPSKEAYIGMSLFYGEDPDMRTFHDAYAPGLVHRLSEAMQVFAERNLRASAGAPSAAPSSAAVREDGA
jgi:hypothetical protein